MAAAAAAAAVAVSVVAVVVVVAEIAGPLKVAYIIYLQSHAKKPRNEISTLGRHTHTHREL